MPYFSDRHSISNTDISFPFQNAYKLTYFRSISLYRNYFRITYTRCSFPPIQNFFITVPDICVYQNVPDICVYQNLTKSIRK